MPTHPLCGVKMPTNEPSLHLHDIQPILPVCSDCRYKILFPLCNRLFGIYNRFNRMQLGKWEQMPKRKVTKLTLKDLRDYAFKNRYAEFDLNNSST